MINLNRLFPTFYCWLSEQPRGELGAWTRRRGTTWRVQSWWLRDRLESQQRSLLRLIAIAHRESLPLAVLVANQAKEERGAYRRVLRRLALRLSQGMPLLQALEQTPRSLSNSDLLALRIGSHSGTWSASLATRLAPLDPHRSFLRRLATQTVGYLLSTLAVLLLVTLFISVFIVPTGMLILGEFGTAPRNSLRFLRGLSEWSPVWGPVVLVLVIAGAWFYWSVPGQDGLRRMAGWGYRLFPHRVRYNAVLPLLVPPCQAGRPLTTTLSTLARYHADRLVRNQLLYVRNEIEQGEAEWMALAKIGLVSSKEADALKLATSPQHRAWLLQQFIEIQRQRFYEKLERWIYFVQPVLIIALGAFVLWIWTGFFPLIAGGPW
jgi:general secretion pathway protein F